MRQPICRTQLKQQSSHNVKWLFRCFGHYRHFVPSCSSDSWQHSKKNDKSATILCDDAENMDTNEGLTSNQQALLDVWVVWCVFIGLKKKRRKWIQCEGCWDLAEGWVEVVSQAGKGHDPEIDTGRRSRPLWIIIKHISMGKRAESTEEYSDAQQQGGIGSANGIHLVTRPIKVLREDIWKVIGQTVHLWFSSKSIRCCTASTDWLR